MERAQGLIQIKPKIKVKDAFTLSLVYTPGVCIISNLRLVNVAWK